MVPFGCMVMPVATVVPVFPVMPVMPVMPVIGDAEEDPEADVF